VGAAKHAEVTAREAEVLALIARHRTGRRHRGSRLRLARFPITFGQLGCPYQQTRTRRLAADVR